jgi:PAS domain S-box-containing protein
VNGSDELIADSAEDLFEHAPCGYLSTRLDGTILRVNRTFETLTGHGREQLLAGRRFQDLLSPGGRIYHETHFAPLLRMQGAVREIAVEIVRADGTRLPALVNSVLRLDEAGEPASIRTMVFDATDRRSYERELLEARRREQDIALELQRSLLAGSLPACASVELGVAYHPAVEGLEVGGDWYDAFWLEPGAVLALVVGDVVGRGIGAAATMGQLRSAARALALTGPEPGELLDALDAFVRRHAVGQMTTIAYARLDVRSGELCHACAGHPPPLLLAAGADPQYLWEGRSAPLDAQHDPRPRPEARVTLERGDLLALYSDGLVERRRRPPREGMDALGAEVAQRRDEPAGELAAEVARALHDPAHADDVCLLVARRL